MTLLVGRLLLALVLVTAAIAMTVWSVSAGADAVSLFRFEGEDPASLETSWGTIERTTGFGPLERDVVSLEGVREPVLVVRVGDARARWPRSELLVGGHGARYADEPAREGVWLPFAVAAGSGLLLAGLAGWAAVRSFRQVLGTGGEVIFGQRDPNGTTPAWTPGSGTHGGMGGQVPPYVPYNPDWDPKRRIR